MDKYSRGLFGEPQLAFAPMHSTSGVESLARKPNGLRVTLFCPTVRSFVFM